MPSRQVARALRMPEEAIDVEPVVGVARAGLTGGRARRGGEVELEAATPDPWDDVTDVRDRSALGATPERVDEAVHNAPSTWACAPWYSSGRPATRQDRRPSAFQRLPANSPVNGRANQTRASPRLFHSRLPAISNDRLWAQ
ncbi:hypothetical protein ABT404_01690 [Streptomyces hyaluromycini]|uniref:Uncharacterized protein n=1 Tax=Streptomyces hyaluromycini TaxID=1377993 RepID=A0ABV1WMW8_9ACTN